LLILKGELAFLNFIFQTIVSRRKAIALMAMGSVTPPLPAATLSGRNPDVKLLPDVYHM